MNEEMENICEESLKTKKVLFRYLSEGSEGKQEIPQSLTAGVLTYFQIGVLLNKNLKLKPFYYQLMHIMLKNIELLKHSKITLQHVSVYVETIFRELQSVLG